MSAQVNERFYTPRYKALLEKGGETRFWKGQPGSAVDPDTQLALIGLSKENRELLKKLLGPDGANSAEDNLFWQRQQFGNLPAEKINQLQRINSDYFDLIQEAQIKQGSFMLREDREKIAFLEKEKLADLAKVLTPQEFEDLQLRTSSTAGQLRNQLSAFNPTEAEFRAIYQITVTVDAQYGSPYARNFTNEETRKRQEALVAQLQTTLSPERFANYQQATDPAYQQIDRLVARLELPAATSQQVFALQKDMEQRARALQTNRTLAADDRDAQLTALGVEATATLTSTLTPRGFEAYQQNGGYWLQNLKPRPRPTTTSRSGGN